MIDAANVFVNEAQTLGCAPTVTLEVRSSETHVSGRPNLVCVGHLGDSNIDLDRQAEDLDKLVALADRHGITLMALCYADNDWMDDDDVPQDDQVSWFEARGFTVLETSFIYPRLERAPPAA